MELLETLRALEADVAARPAGGPPPDVRGHLHRLDTLAAALPPTADPELRHFLQRRSYEKARWFLEGRAEEIARGGCTRRPTGSA